MSFQTVTEARIDAITHAIGLLDIDLMLAVGEEVRRERLYHNARGRIAQARALIALFDAQDRAAGIAAEITALDQERRVLQTGSAVYTHPAGEIVA